jgi:hypothetical protein
MAIIKCEMCDTDYDTSDNNQCPNCGYDNQQQLDARDDGDDDE